MVPFQGTNSFIFGAVDAYYFRMFSHEIAISQMLHVWIVYLHQLQNGNIESKIWVNIPYMEHLGWGKIFNIFQPATKMSKHHG